MDLAQPEVIPSLPERSYKDLNKNTIYEWLELVIWRELNNNLLYDSRSIRMINLGALALQEMLTENH